MQRTMKKGEIPSHQVQPTTVSTKVVVVAAGVTVVVAVVVR
jgi:hypothetical protein